ncbi:MAG: VWA domain-containing protein [Myxococcota bacterium]
MTHARFRPLLAFGLFLPLTGILGGCGASAPSAAPSAPDGGARVASEVQGDASSPPPGTYPAPDAEMPAPQPAPPTASALGAPEREAKAGAPVLVQPGVAPVTAPEPNREGYAPVVENPFLVARQTPLSTFSIDVDTASYSNTRRFLQSGRRPVNDAVRIEELINYFPYDYAAPTNGKPFAVHLEVNEAPWKKGHRLVRIGLKGKEVPRDQRKSQNLVFLLDVSGSMNSPDKLPLLTRSLSLLVDQLDDRDRVAIVVYAGASGLVLPSTSDKSEIRAALGRLKAGGSTAGAAGIELAYRTASANFIRGGNNRVILATDGDFNVGPSSRGELKRLIEEKAKTGTFLTVLGFGRGNLQDSALELLADKGNGNYAYIDSYSEARKVLVEQMGGTLETIAKDVKIQVEFNPAVVAGYRLIGYENRALRDRDFDDDTKDAGEIGAGHTVTALYEVVPHGHTVPGAMARPALKYQNGRTTSKAASQGELLTVKLRYKRPSGSRSKLMKVSVGDPKATWAGASPDFRFAASVAAYGMLLRKSAHAGSATFAKVEDWARSGLGSDRGGYREKHLGLVRQAAKLR